MLPSRIDTVQFRGRTFYIKRDDLIDTCLSGNKYRKLYSLIQTPSSTYKKIISYGGGQSNAMLAIACLCRSKGWEFHYYTKNLPKVLKGESEGNLELAIKEGMIVHEVPHEAYQHKIDELQNFTEEGALVISQGGADELAKEGVYQLADEINRWKKANKLESLCVVLPSGTGTTALYLRASLDEDILVYTSVLIGDEAYQFEQWNRLSKGPYPQIFTRKKKQRFAKPYDEYFEMHQELKASTGITFDLIYAPRTWIDMCENLDKQENILYIHTGGVSGNATMLDRYRYKKSRQG
jgi:1-aminocyclopropane-1-carboxylate deaminase/D-cysteine desulfhydrase-like pyridoxal-dependent ACC family enzyme